MRKPMTTAKLQSIGKAGDYWLNLSDVVGVERFHVPFDVMQQAR